VVIALLPVKLKGDYFCCGQYLLSDETSSISSMGLVRLKVKELAQQRGWTLKKVSDLSGVPYSTVRTYARTPSMAMVDLSAVQKIARAFEISIEDLIEVIE
jgi:DNA-binding Xre family transcriptional regulator